ncbi:MAG: GNAT family N-acetyltransferase [Pseudomonadota bacterium]
MCSVPQIVTENLILRGHRATDHAAALELWQNEDVYRYITGEPLSSQDVWLRLLRYSGLWDFLGFGYWAVEHLQTGAYLGQVGFADFKRGLSGFEDHHPEAGWILHPKWGGQGLATEAMTTACKWLDAQEKWQKSFCIISTGNAVSIHLAEKLGYHYTQDTLFGDEPTGVYFRER